MTSYSYHFKIKILYFSFPSEIICLISLIYTLILLAFIRSHFTLFIFLALTAKLSIGIILSYNLREDFYLIEVLKYSLLSLSVCKKSFDNNKMLLFYNIHAYLIRTLCFINSDFIQTILATILSILLSKISSKLSLYGSRTGFNWLWVLLSHILRVCIT